MLLNIDMSYLTEQELLDRCEYYTVQMEERLLESDDFEDIADQIPFVAHLNDPDTLEVVQTNKRHSQLTGYHIDEIRDLGMTYINEHVHPHTMETLSELLPQLYSEMNANKTFLFVQYVKPRNGKDFSPLITFTKSTKLQNGLVPCLSFIPQDFDSMAKKMEQVVKMDQFKLKHFKRFQQLTEREIEVLKLLANGLNNPQIADKLFLSRQTVETHRKNLKRKLELRSFRDLMRYAFAFNLVEV